MVTGRRLFYGICWLLLVLAFLTVPMPFFTLSPGGAIEVDSLLEVDGEQRELQGDAALLAVTISSPSLATLVLARLDDEVEITERQRLLPDGQDDDEYFDQQADVFTGALDISAAVAMRAAGLDVRIESLPQVVQVLRGSPADGQLVPGDLVTTVQGVEVETAEDLIDEVRRLDAGDVARITALRDGEEVEVEITLDVINGMTRAGLGITIDTTPRNVDLPIDVRLKDDVRIGGPSAGLMFAVTIFDLVSDEDLLGGRRVAGTGSLALDGSVGRIGSIEQKVFAAEREGYSIFLAPASQAAAARAVASPSLQVVAVETFEDALTALRAAPDPV